jgi:RNA recognition motif-containing protein
MLTKSFMHYKSFAMAKVIRDKLSGRTRGFGFVSFRNPDDFLKALKDMDGKFVGTQPIKLKKSTWKSRQYDPETPTLLGDDFSHFRQKK